MFFFFLLVKIIEFETNTKISFNVFEKFTIFIQNSQNSKY